MGRLGLVDGFMPETARIIHTALAILRLQGDAYTVPIRTEIEQRTGRHVSRGALFTSLERLEAKSLVRSRLGDPTPERGGRAKRYFSVTTAGLAAVRESRAAMQKMWQGLDSIVERS